jgi:hypothetical protein
MWRRLVGENPDIVPGRFDAFRKDRSEGAATGGGCRHTSTFHLARRSGCSAAEPYPPARHSDYRQLIQRLQVWRRVMRCGDADALPQVSDLALRGSPAPNRQGSPPRSRIGRYTEVPTGFTCRAESLPPRQPLPSCQTRGGWPSLRLERSRRPCRSRHRVSVKLYVPIISRCSFAQDADATVCGCKVQVRNATTYIHNPKSIINAMPAIRASSRNVTFVIGRLNTVPRQAHCIRRF